MSNNRKNSAKILLSIDRSDFHKMLKNCVFSRFSPPFHRIPFENTGFFWGMCLITRRITKHFLRIFLQSLNFERISHCFLRFCRLLLQSYRNFFICLAHTRCLQSVGICFSVPPALLLPESFFFEQLRLLSNSLSCKSVLEYQDRCWNHIIFAFAKPCKS